MWYGTNFSEPVFKKILQQHRQSYYHVCWGGQGHLEKYQDLMPDYNADPRRATPPRRWTCSRITAQPQAADLETRIADMTAVLDEASDQIEDLSPLFVVY